MAGVKEAHILKKFNRVIFPRTLKEHDIPPVNDILGPDFDYPRIAMTNSESANLKYHKEALRSGLADVIFRSSNGPSTSPPNPILYQTNWFTENKLDKLPVAPSRDDFGQSVMLIPIMRHRIKTDPESMILMLILTEKGILLVNPLEHRCKRSLKHLLESDDIFKILLNGSSEIHLYWTLLQSACRKIFCLTTHLKSIVNKKDDNWTLYYTAGDIMAKFNEYYQIRSWKTLILQSEQESIGGMGLLRDVKCTALQEYATTCVELLDAFSNDDRTVSTAMDWGYCMEPMGSYLTLEGLTQIPFWKLVAKGLNDKKIMHYWLPLIFNTCFRQYHGRMHLVQECDLEAAYQSLMNEKLKPNNGQPNTLTADLCQESADVLDTFLACLLLPAGERNVRTDICCIPGCFNDVMRRMFIMAPMFFNEFRQGF